MHLDSHGKLVDEREIKVGFIGCGSHSLRNLFPVFAFAHVDLVAVCDLDRAKAERFARTFGARAVYTDRQEMLQQEELDAVLICTGYNERGRPTYPVLATECLDAGVHVWIEKPPAASTDEIRSLIKRSEECGKIVMTGLKKMFFPANVKAAELMHDEGFGATSLVHLQYPQSIPPVESLQSYIDGKSAESGVIAFLDHLCHPVSLMLLLLGRPATLIYERSAAGGGAALFTFASGAVCSLSFTEGASPNGGMESTLIVGSGGTHITIENNLTVTLHRTPPLRYGKTTSFYGGGSDSGSVVWEPEFSLGNLYNKGIFVMGYHGEIEEFAQAVLNDRPPTKGTLDDALAVTAIFEAFAQGPSRQIAIRY